MDHKSLQVEVWRNGQWVPKHGAVARRVLLDRAGRVLHCAYCGEMAVERIEGDAVCQNCGYAALHGESLHND